jgi:lambda repressor-like predicted transcriptional regulator
MTEAEKELIKALLNGEEPDLKEVARILRIAESTLRSRLKRGWPLGDAIFNLPITTSEAGRMGKKKSPWAKEGRWI